MRPKTWRLRRIERPGQRAMAVSMLRCWATRCASRDCRARWPCSGSRATWVERRWALRHSRSAMRRSRGVIRPRPGSRSGRPRPAASPGRTRPRVAPCASASRSGAESRSRASHSPGPRSNAPSRAFRRVRPRSWNQIEKPRSAGRSWPERPTAHQRATGSTTGVDSSMPAPRLAIGTASGRAPRVAREGMARDALEGFAYMGPLRAG